MSPARRMVAVALALPALALSGCSSEASSGPMRPSVTDAAWGEVDGRPVRLFALENARGTVCKISTYGATVTELHVPDRDGERADVVLGFDALEDYVEDSPYFGCIVGRVANRIAKGRFTLAGDDYVLARNNGPNHLHGGEAGFDKAVWTPTSRATSEGSASVTLTYRSEDGEEGYPGTLDATVVYTLTGDDELRIEMTATADRKTIVNLAHHTYWNLGGHDSGTILDHELELECSRYTPADDTLIPTGEIAAVEGTPYDFREPKAIGADLAVLQARDDAGHGGGYDINFAVDGEPGTVRPVATVHHPGSGRVMELHSDQPGLQFYTGNFLDGTLKGKGGAVYAKYSGFCLETQKYPDAIHHPDFPSVVLEPGETYRHVMVHRFSTR